MREPIIIGCKSYKYKKDALAYYRNILNSYSFDQFVDNEHLNDLIDLINYNISLYSDKISEEVLVNIADVKKDAIINEELANLVHEIFIVGIKISKIKYDTRCFEIVYTDDTTCLMSYIMYLSVQKPNPIRDFNRACRNAIQNDMRLVKLSYFKQNSIKGKVKCQETGELHRWEDLVVDHRQPNTFSMIVERFKEIHKIDIHKIEYEELDKLLFDDKILMQNFVNYHKEKANLRVIKKEKNSSRTGMARIKQSPRDLKIE